MKYIIVILLILFVILSIVISMDNHIDLGDNFRFIEYDDEMRVVLYCTGHCNTSGTYVLESNVISFDHDDNWIIAKRQHDRYGIEVSYWVVDKYRIILEVDNYVNIDSGLSEFIRSHVHGPLDSLQFVDFLRINNIELEL